MFINRQRREITMKIVYYGPPLSGKTTNLEQIHAGTPKKTRSDLVSLKTREDRTLFFDFMQLELGTVGGMRPKFQLYTVPGQVMYTLTRKIVLQGADGVVFVADSAAHRIKDNVASWKQLHQHLLDLGTDVKTFPLVVQWNKRDLRDALPVPRMKQALSVNGRHTLESIAIEGIGVRKTLRVVLNEVLKQALPAAR